LSSPTSVVISSVGRRSLTRAKVEHPKRPHLTLGDFGERNGLASRGVDEHRLALKVCFGSRALLKPLKMGRADHHRIAASQPDRIRIRDGQRRDVVQRGRKGPEMLQGGRTITKTFQKVQR